MNFQIIFLHNEFHCKRYCSTDIESLPFFTSSGKPSGLNSSSTWGWREAWGVAHARIFFEMLWRASCTLLASSFSSGPGVLCLFPDTRPSCFLAASSSFWVVVIAGFWGVFDVDLLLLEASWLLRCNTWLCKVSLASSSLCRLTKRLQYLSVLSSASLVRSSKAPLNSWISICNFCMLMLSLLSSPVIHTKGNLDVRALDESRITDDFFRYLAPNAH